MSGESTMRRLVGARALGTLGRTMTSATVLWELYERTHDTWMLGAVGLVQVIPVALLFVWSGALVDRSDRRRLTSQTTVAKTILGALLALVSFLSAPPLVILGLLLVQGCVTSVHQPSSHSLVPLVIERDQLERTNRISSSLTELAAIVGPALAGLALIAVEPAWIYVFVALTQLGSALLYRSLPRPRLSAAPAAEERRDWRVGLRYIFRSRLLLPAITLDMFAVLFAGVTALLPAIATDVLHVDAFGYGVLRSAESAGAVLMAVVGGRIAPWKRPGKVLLVVVALYGVAMVGFGLSRSFWLSVALLFVCGALDNISVVIRLSLEQLVVPDAIRGRVAAVHFVFIGMSNELGAAESGFAAGLIGTIPTIVGGGLIAALVVALVAWRWPALASMPPLSQLAPEEPR